MGLFATVLMVGAPSASAQNVADIVDQLEQRGYYIESGAEGDPGRFEDLVSQGARTQDNWYFVSMSDTVPDDFADDLFSRVSPAGNVLVYFFDAEGFVNVQLATNASEFVEDQALQAFEGNWDQPEDFMDDVVRDFEALQGNTAGSTTSSGSTTSTTGSGSSSSGGGFPWLLVGIPVLFIGGLWFMNSRSKKSKAEDDLETAQKIRAELQTELDELANDVLVLSGPTDVSENKQAIEYYREATDTYLLISDEIPEVEQLEAADLKELAELGARVANARWQMDAAEAIIEGDPIPEKPKVAPPPAPKPRAQDTRQPRPQARRQMPQRQPRPRVPYSRSRRSSGGGLLDILIAGAGMMGRSGGRGGGMFGGSRGRTSSRGGGMFGGNSRGSSRSRQSSPRAGGGVFGGRSSSRSSGRSRSTTRRSSGRASTSRRRRRTSAKHS